MNASGADAGGDTEGQGGDHIAELLCSQVHLVWMPDVGDHEFFSARAADDCGVVGGVPQRACHRDQRIVAGAVSVVVVELLEAVQVDHGDDEMSELVATLLQARFRATVKGAPVQQSGELVTFSPHGIGAEHVHNRLDAERHRQIEQQHQR